MQALEGSQAMAKAVGLCRPGVIAAYPITPQTHIVEHLADLVADGYLQAEYVSAESEFRQHPLFLGQPQQARDPLRQQLPKAWPL